MNTNIIQQSIETGRTWFNTAFETGVRLQDQSEQIVRSYVEQTPWFDENARKTVDIWLNSYKQGREALKKAMDENFNNIEKIFTTM